jgi:hypothetical protein
MDVSKNFGFDVSEPKMHPFKQSLCQLFFSLKTCFFQKNGQNAKKSTFSDAALSVFREISGGLGLWRLCQGQSLAARNPRRKKAVRPDKV